MEFELAVDEFLGNICHDNISEVNISETVDDSKHTVVDEPGMRV